MPNVTKALTRKFGPLPAWGWLGLFGAGVYWYRSRSGGSSSAGATAGGADLATLADLGYTAVPNEQTGGGGGAAGDGSSGTPAKPKRPRKRPKRRHHKPRAKQPNLTHEHNRRPRPKPHSQPPANHPRTHAGRATKQRTPVGRRRPS